MYAESIQSVIPDYSELKGRIKSKFGTQEAFARAIGLSTVTVSNKLNGKVDFSQSEIKNSCKALEIPLSEVDIYFFDLKVKEV